MPLYSFSGVGRDGKSVKGLRDADSPKGLRQLLRKEGVTVIDSAVSKGKGGGVGKGLNRSVNFGELFTRVKKTEVSAFTRQLATLLGAGIPLAESLNALFDQSENVKLKAILEQVKTDVNEGAALADAMHKHPTVFDDLFVSMVRAGETAGNLDDVLTRLADFMESAEHLRDRVKSALTYPVIMIVVGGIIMTILMVAVVPKITEIFMSQGATLPLPTRFLVFCSDLMAGWWWAIALVLGLALYGFRRWSHSESGRSQWHGFLLRVALVGPLLRQVAVARFSRTVGTMLHAGVPLLKVLDIAKETLGNVILVKDVENARDAVTEGEALAAALKRSGRFPPSMLHMVSVGERSGTLEQMLLRVSDAYDHDVDSKLSRLTTLLGPIMLVGMGGTVAFIVVSILLPMMDLQKVMQF